MRGASESTSKRHQRSCEYSTWRNAKNASHVALPSTTATATNQRTPSGACSSDEWRVKWRRHGRWAASSTESSAASSQSSPFTSDMSAPAASSTAVAPHAKRIRWCSPRASTSSATPTMLARKWLASISESGTAAASQRTRPPAVGSAPDTIRIAPAQKVEKASARGTSAGATRATNFDTRSTPERRRWSSWPAKTIVPIASGTR